jgi:hypothetical protein
MDKEIIQPSPENPSREEITESFLAAALNVPQDEDYSGKIKVEGQLGLKKAYRHSFRDNICKELAAILVPSSEVDPDKYGRAPLIKEVEREKLVEEIIGAATISESRESQVAEVVRLGGIQYERVGLNMTPVEEIKARNAVITEQLLTLSDEELSTRLQRERHRVVSSVLRPIIRGGFVF